MKVLYDHQAFAGQRFGGISRYFVQLLKHLKYGSSLKVDYSLIYSENFYIKELGFKNYFSLLQENEFKGKYRLIKFFSKLNEINSKRLIKKNKYDIFHPTYYDPYFLNHIGSKPFVLTVYDLIHERFSNSYFKNNELAIENKCKLILKANKIIAISDNTKNDLINYYKIDKDKIDVIYLANSLNLNCFEKIKAPKRYILFVGDRTRYKNFIFFIKSITSTLLSNKDLYVVCAGGRGFNKEELQLFKELGIFSKLIQFAINDNQLVYLYTKALMFVFPSLYEGFGIPVLEAMSCGCPLVISKIAPFIEIAQDSAEYFDPKNSDSIKYAVENVLLNTLLRDRLIREGLKRINFFNWKKVSQETQITYSSVI